MSKEFFSSVFCLCCATAQQYTARNAISYWYTQDSQNIAKVILLGSLRAEARLRHPKNSLNIDTMNRGEG
jgi:hypothetical protein